MTRKKKDQSQDSQQSEQQQYSTMREYFIATVYCTIIALFVTTYVVHPMTVPTPSMEPTILVGDRLLIDKFTFRNEFMSTPPLTPAHKIQRGDIIVFKFPDEPEVLYVKRAIGLPGETLEIRDKTVYIDGQPLDEPYKYHADSTIRASNPHMMFPDAKRDNLPPVTIPEGNYFMMGDNRDDSADSRYFGFLPRDYIVGRPLIVFWSYEDDSDAYLRTSLPEMVKLYGERLIYFFTRTRWSRMGHFVN